MYLIERKEVTILSPIDDVSLVRALKEAIEYISIGTNPKSAILLYNDIYFSVNKQTNIDKCVERYSNVRSNY